MKITPPALNSQLTSMTISSLDDDIDTVNGISVENELITLSRDHLSITRSRISKSDLTHAKLEGLSLDNVVFENCNMLTGAFSDSSWHSTMIINSLCSGIQLDRSTLKNVAFIGCKLDLANFRYAKMTNVLFDKCNIDNIDLYSSTLKKISFNDCEINNIELQGSLLNNVDFRDSKFVRIKKSTDLKGATISSEQLVFLSPQLANQAGIIVED